MKLEGKVAIVTGGSKGLGLGCARVFAKHGASVVIAARGEEAGQQAQQELIDAGHAAHFVAADATREADVQGVIDAALERFERIDCLLNSIGWHPPATTIDQISVEEFEEHVRVNLTGTFIGCKLAVPQLRKTRGCIINMSDEVALVGQGESPSYVAAKAGQIGLTRALALDLAPEGVRVNAVCPTAVLTPQMQEWADAYDDAEAALKMVDSWHALGRMATAEEIGEVCAFLASDEAAFITGQAICPDGGASLGYRR
jgi:NAD(P)-dependent dehydrogenase (short-subunit alcohol dehydrogenase family)